MRFESPFLSELAEDFRKRRRSLSRRSHRAEMQKAYEVVGEERVERLEIYLQQDHRGNSPTLRLHAWPDRLLWLDARAGSKNGWLWSWTADGRLLGEHWERRAIQALEASYDLLRQMDQSHVAKLSERWSALLARGPKEVTILALPARCNAGGHRGSPRVRRSPNRFRFFRQKCPTVASPTKIVSQSLFALRDAARRIKVDELCTRRCQRGKCTLAVAVRDGDVNPHVLEAPGSHFADNLR